MSDENPLVRLGDCLTIGGDFYMLASAGHDVAIIVNLARGTRWGGLFGITPEGIRFDRLVEFVNTEFPTPYSVERIGYGHAFTGALSLRKRPSTTAF